MLGPHRYGMRLVRSLVVLAAAWAAQALPCGRAWAAGVDYTAQSRSVSGTVHHGYLTFPGDDNFTVSDSDAAPNFGPYTKTLSLSRYVPGSGSGASVVAFQDSSLNPWSLSVNATTITSAGPTTMTYGDNKGDASSSFYSSFYVYQAVPGALDATYRLSTDHLGWPTFAIQARLSGPHGTIYQVNYAAKDFAAPGPYTFDITKVENVPLSFEPGLWTLVATVSNSAPTVIGSYQYSGGAASLNLVLTVPEPAGACMLGFASVALLLRRRARSAA